MTDDDLIACAIDNLRDALAREDHELYAELMEEVKTSPDFTDEMRQRILDALRRQ